MKRFSINKKTAPLRQSFCKASPPLCVCKGEVYLSTTLYRQSHYSGIFSFFKEENSVITHLESETYWNVINPISGCTLAEEIEIQKRIGGRLPYEAQLSLIRRGIVGPPLALKSRSDKK